MIKIIITGAKGRMGEAILACSAKNAEFQVVGQIDLGDNLLEVIDRGDVVLDFSFHAATPGIARPAERNRFGSAAA